MSDRAKPSNPNALLIAFRKYHTWLGLALTAFIVTVSLTGIYLNHKDLFRSGKPGRDRASKEPASRQAPGDPDAPLTTATDLNSLPVTFARALAMSRERLGDEPVERIELKNEKGSLVYKVKAASGELTVDASSGEVVTRTREARLQGQKKPASLTASEHEARDEKKGGTDWGKIIKDLHTGKVGGLVGKLLVDATALVLVVLCVTGVYLWAVPKYRKWRSARQRAFAGRTVVPPPGQAHPVAVAAVPGQG